MRKILLLTICVSMFGYLGAQESVTYGIKYNNETKKMKFIELMMMVPKLF